MNTNSLARRFPWLALTVVLVAVHFARSEVVRFEISARDDFAEGRSFGETGAYERIVGRVFYEIDPELPQNQNVVDLKLAPRTDEGKVEFFGDLFILAPKDLSKASGALLYDVNNRGNKLALRFFNFASGGNHPQSMEHAGDGFLMRNGFIVVWSGWDGELLPGNQRLRLAPPVAGVKETLTGLVRCEIVPTKDCLRSMINWENHGSYRPTKSGMETATLTHRVRPLDPRVIVRRDQWSLHVSDVTSDAPSQLPKIELEYPAGLKRGHIYELIYEAQDPLVHGTCFTSLRDLISAFRHGDGKNNPLMLGRQPVVKRAHGFGVSQSGRFLREFLHGGFNEDERGRKVFDGLIPHVSGAGLGSFNHRFAQPTRHVTQHDHHDYPADRFPFTYETQYDPLSRQTDGILKRADATNTTPFVLHTQSTAEYWTRSGSLAHTDPLGRYDSELPANVRIYLFGGTQHGPSSFPPTRGSGQNLANPGDYRPFLRALLLSLDRCMHDGSPLPPSVYPTIRAGTLVDWNQASTAAPSIPGVRYPTVIQQPSCWDYGPRWWRQKIIDRQPPGTYGDYRVFVPACDVDGNQLDCLSPPEVAVPVATYTGWNLRSKAAGAENELVSLGGSYIPFPVTNEQRIATNDPRRSVQQRYGSLNQYLAKLEKICRQLHETGCLLEEDIHRTLQVQRERVAPLFAAIELARAAAAVRQTVAHRGASLERPENTLSAIRRAIEVGAGTVEMDVRTSKDGVLVLLHDATLDRTTRETGPANQLTITQLRQLDAGSWFEAKYAGERIPTLQEVLRICRGRTRVLLDLKEQGEDYAKQVADCVNEFGSAAETIIGVRSVEQAKSFRRLLPEAKQLGLVPDLDSIDSFASAGVDTIRIWPRWLSEPGVDVVNRVKQANVHLHLNGKTGKREELVPLLQHRPDSISSDDPAMLLRTLHEFQTTP